MKRGTCATCRYFHDAVYPAECRLDPPTPLIRNDIGEVKSHYPNVDSNDWCGGWEDDKVNGKRKTYPYMLNDGDVEPPKDES